jgi:hypothetical protein
MAQIHAAQFVTGSVEIGCGLAERETQDFGDLLIGFPARRPEEEWLFPVDSWTGNGGIRN